ncbi:MAG TPA: UDP-N-acetylmuramoyl-tripeptide--D-alanyl-D-alanine ligase [Anaerolineae bacterium]|nr:UDP-N-acetylmuramoyl-tripeptide--D-alanyl-D-alanine ligase [Anaerolineae bacterium]
MLTLADVIEGLTGQRPSQMDRELTEVVIDSRLAIPGSLFIALRGERRDGHDFVPDALERGAIAVIAEEKIKGYGLRVNFVEADSPLSPIPYPLTPICLVVEDSLAALQRLAAYWRAKHDVRVIGVTGSVGKTTTKELIASVLSRRFHTLKSEGNYNTEIGLPLTLLHLKPSHERAVLEMGMYALGDIAQLAAIARPHIGVVTNVGPVHLERLGTIERIAQAKSELPAALPEDGVAILNGDDPRVRAMAEKTKARVFFYGLDESCDLWASHIESKGLEGIRFLFHYGSEAVHAKVPLLGRHSVHTALAAAAVGLVEGESWGEIMDGLRNAAQLRLVVVPGLRGSTILDDTYNASPASTIAALNLLEELEGRRIAVLGDMLELGTYEEEGHRKVGRRAMDVVALLVTVGKRARIIGEEALLCGMDRDRVFMTENKEEAIAHLRHIVAPGDIILVKGSRGMRMEEIVAALSNDR